jgi:hypothetical protein
MTVTGAGPRPGSLPVVTEPPEQLESSDYPGRAPGLASLRLQVQGYLASITQALSVLTGRRLGLGCCFGLGLG